MARPCIKLVHVGLMIGVIACWCINVSDAKLEVGEMVCKPKTPSVLQAEDEASVIVCSFQVTVSPSAKTEITSVDSGGSKTTSRFESCASASQEGHVCVNGELSVKENKTEKSESQAEKEEIQINQLYFSEEADQGDEILGAGSLGGSEEEEEDKITATEYEMYVHPLVQKLQDNDQRKKIWHSNAVVGEIFNNLAEACVALGELKVAKQAYRKSMEWHERHHLAPTILGVLNDKNIKNDADQVMQQQVELLAGYQQVVNEKDQKHYYKSDDSYVGDLLSKLGSIYLLMGEPEPAIESFEAAISLYLTQSEDRARAIADTSYELSIAYYRSTRYPDSQRAYFESMDIYRELYGDGVNPFCEGLKKEKEMPVEDSGGSFKVEGDELRASDSDMHMQPLQEKCEKGYQKKLNLQVAVGDLFNILPNICFDLGEYAMAKQAYQDSMEWHERHNLEPSKTGYLNNYDSVDEGDTILQERLGILVVYRQAVYGNKPRVIFRDKESDEEKHHDKRDDRYEGNLLFEIGSIYLSMGEPEPAIAYLEEAIALYLTQAEDRARDIADATYELSVAYYMSKRYAGSQRLYFKSLDMFLALYGDGFSPFIKKLEEDAATPTEANEGAPGKEADDDDDTMASKSRIVFLREHLHETQNATEALGIRGAREEL